MITRAINKLKLRKFLPQNKIKITKNKSKKTSYLKKVKWLDLKWNNLPEVLEVKNPIINHYPAMPYEERFKKMKKDLKETFER